MMLNTELVVNSKVSLVSRTTMITTACGQLKKAKDNPRRLSVKTLYSLI